MGDIGKEEGGEDGGDGKVIYEGRERKEGV